jgi:hypothetical protein
LAVATETPGRLFEPRHPPAGAPTSLEDAILGLCEELTVEGVAECPVCAGPMRAASACERCGSELG